MRSVYSEAQLTYLEVGFKEMDLAVLTENFNVYFGLDKSVSAIKSTLSNHGFRCGRPTGRANTQSKKYTPEIIEFIRIRYRETTLREITTELQEFYDLRISLKNLSSLCKAHGIKSGRTGYFEKGCKPWTTGTKGVVKSNSGSFKPGSVPPSLKPIGHERICAKSGYPLVKVAERNPYTGAPTRYKPKHHVIFEQANNRSIKDGHVLVFMNGDQLNCQLENLKEIPRSLLVRLNKLRYWNQPTELRPTIWAQAELQAAIGTAKRRMTSSNENRE